MLKITELKPGVLIELEGVPFQVISASHQMLGRGHGMTRAKLKNLKTGALIERVFRNNETILEAEIEKIKATYLWNDKNHFYFMDIASLEQFSLAAESVGFAKNFLKEGEEVEINLFKKEPLGINLPIKINLKVVETEPEVRTGRETPGTKGAVLETGYKIQVPLFIKKGDIIKVDTRTGSYIERAK